MKTAFLTVLLCAGVVVAESAAPPTPFFQGNGVVASFRSFEDDAGGFYIAWADEGVGESNTLRAQHVGPKGEHLWQADGLVVTSSLLSLKDWSGLADGQGGLTLFWDEDDGVHAQRFRPDGTRRRPGNSVQMSSSKAVQPDATPDAAGGTLIVWREYLATGRSVLMAQHIDSQGKRLWPKSGIRVSLRASYQTNPRVVYDNESGMIVAWRDEVNTASELRVQRIDFQGNRFWTLEGLSVTAPMGLSEYPQIAPVGTGAAVLAWTASQDQTNQIFLQKVGPNAALQWGDMKLASSSPILDSRWNPLLVGDEGGGTWIAWEDYRDQVNYQIQLNHVDGSGKSVWPHGEIAVAPAPGDQGKAAMVLDSKGGVWIAWIDNRLATIGVYLQELDGSGTGLLGKAGRLVVDNLSKPTTPQLISLGAGKVAVIWADRPKKGRWALFWTIE